MTGTRATFAVLLVDKALWQTKITTWLNIRVRFDAALSVFKPLKSERPCPRASRSLPLANMRVATGLRNTISSGGEPHGSVKVLDEHGAAEKELAL